MGLPSSPFWRFSLQVHARDGVAAACIALQDREDADVHLVLLALWLATRGHPLAWADGQILMGLSKRWQGPIVQPLRDVRRRLKHEPPPPWAEAVEAWRRRLGEVELAMEQVEQLLLEEAVGKSAEGSPDASLTAHNLAAVGLAHVVGTEEMDLLRRAVFSPEPAAPNGS